MAYNVYRVEYRLGFQDPLMGPQTRFHNAIFVETEANGDGRVIQVGGDIVSASGMTFEEKLGKRPEEDESYQRKYFLGQIRASEYQNVVQLLRTVRPPPRQRTYNIQAQATVPCKPDGSLYGPGETPPPYRKCTEWTLQDAIPTLQSSGLLHPNGIPQPQPTA
ncbi:hypothetical protein BDV96DRAFT_294693 [Lophiotrema nucula]|uniref:Uncharacterized protein n=1 Tax=Lophiotrema nucula TaxID=690887 RepID=A0A6A5YLC7_9PLEO|nr:hypothetical protein BDV96DRAFT_294693 [Lophiotrema nucula]